jgi:hypothetical protein
MAEIHQPAPALLLVAATSRYAEALQWAEQRTIAEIGPLAFVSVPFDFTETDYYIPTMGTDLKKQFLAFERLIDPGQLAAIKRLTNQWEQDYATTSQHAETRPLNLDPGYITSAKLVLASTKDHAHRIYLSDGIYAEVTLAYRDKQWRPQAWTYPDYRRKDYHLFFLQCRAYFRQQCDSGEGRQAGPN